MALKDILDELYADDSASFRPYRRIFSAATAAERGAALRPLLAEGGGPQVVAAGPGVRGSDLAAMGQMQAQRAASGAGAVATVEGAGRLQAQDADVRYRQQRRAARAAYEAAMQQGISDVVASNVGIGYSLLSNPDVRHALDKPRRDAQEAKAYMKLYENF